MRYAILLLISSTALISQAQTPDNTSCPPCDASYQAPKTNGGIANGKTVINIALDPQSYAVGSTSNGVDENGDPNPPAPPLTPVGLLRVRNAVDCAKDAWNSTAVPFSFVFLPQGSTQKPDIVVYRSVVPGGGFAAISDKSLEMYLSARVDSGNQSVTDNCGRITHEFAHPMGLENADPDSCAAYSPNAKSIMFSASADGKRSINTPQPTDVAQILAAATGTSTNCTAKQGDTQQEGDTPGGCDLPAPCPGATCGSDNSWDASSCGCSGNVPCTGSVCNEENYQWDTTACYCATQAPCENSPVCDEEANVWYCVDTGEQDDPPPCSGAVKIADGIWNITQCCTADGGQQCCGGP